MDTFATKGKSKRKRKRSNKKNGPSSSDPTQSLKPVSLQQPESFSPQKKFLAASDGDMFTRTMNENYNGFSILSSSQMDSIFHIDSRSALERLRDAGFYHYDIVMAGGKNLSRTFVKRTIVGDPGMTYKYLGLRLFCHPWSGDDATPLFRELHRMNQSMVKMTQEEQRKHNKTTGSCNYNLTLINYMEPYSQVDLKAEEQYGMGKSSVSWHADSSLQDNSCIGVYQILPTQRKTKSTTAWDWKIALRPNDPDDTATLPIVVDTDSESAYFLLDDFNERCQHMVLAGSGTYRISSTHRVAVTESDTYEYIKNRTAAALVAAKRQVDDPDGGVDAWDVNVILESQAVLTEIEFEWIAQYWIQGAEYDRQHVYWQAKMNALEKAWNSLEKLTFRIVEAIVEWKTGDLIKQKTLIEGLVDALKDRQSRRTKWDERRADKIYQRRVPRPYQPVHRPAFQSQKKRLSKDLGATIQRLSKKSRSPI